MNKRTLVLGAVLTLIGLPAVVTAIEAISFYTRNRSNGSLISSGHKREYLLYVPTSYDPKRPTPLVISMHGAGGWPVQQRDLSGWNRLAEREGFIVVYPAGSGRRGPRVWHASNADVGFISDLIDKLEASYNIDPARIYANGISNGAGMSFVLSCTLSDRIAAVGLVGAAHLLPWSWCKDHRPVPMISFHGTADPMTPYKGGSTWVADKVFPDIPTWTANWARRNRCATSPVNSAFTAGVTRIAYPDCDAPVVLYKIDGGGHTWPGGQHLPEWFAGPTSRNIDATAQMWEFFRAHPLRGK